MIHDPDPIPTKLGDLIPRPEVKPEPRRISDTVVEEGGKFRTEKYPAPLDITIKMRLVFTGKMRPRAYPLDDEPEIDYTLPLVGQCKHTRVNVATDRCLDCGRTGFEIMQGMR